EKIFQTTPPEFKKDLTTVVFASSIESSRPALSGIYMKNEEDGFIFVATDGYRLSLQKDPKQKVEKEDNKPLIVPARIIREALSLKEEGPIDVFISENHNQIIFSQEETLLVGRLIEAEFPNYQKIIPTDMSAKVTFDREDLLKAVKTCSVFARDSANIITLSLKKDTIIVSAKTPSLGENTVEVEASLIGEENEIAFNARYLLDVLSAVEDDSMYFEMTGPLNAGVFRIANNPNFLHLIMPIRT
ncbi:MAG: DNA polymerase III subunit beta, partial [Patescibacteria group bacterium]|nr:DNA polymerase III subunit beta [Patescibacteria group bacterium]